MKMYNIPTPTMAQVIMVDDPITTTEFVISALRDFCIGQHGLRTKPKR